MTSSVIQLECQCNNYPWGRTGKESLAAQYAAATPGGKFELDPKKQYAEMWMGTYPTTPSLILSNGRKLQDHINDNKEHLIGKPILAKFGADLPYLPKILSIAKALPLQIHPDKSLAAKLHRQDPDKFGDANHKPEIAVALGKFEVFVGWQPMPEIQELFTTISILKSRFARDIETPYDGDALKRIVFSILSAKDEVVKEVYETLNATHASSFGTRDYIPRLLPRLAEQYDKSDPGNLIALLTMNYLVLEKGDAIYVPADGIHAYLSGDIVECMARSDNVLNTGFCPRADRDSVELFTSALSFSPKSAQDAILKSEKSTKGKNGHTKILAPPMSEFDMLLVSVPNREAELIQALQGPSIMVVTGGSGTLRVEKEEFQLREGYVFFVGYNTDLEFVAEKDLEIHLAFAEAK